MVKTLSLRTRLLLVTTAILAITVIVLIIFNYKSTQDTMMQTYEVSQKNLTRDLSKIVSKDFEKYISGLKQFSYSLNLDETKDIRHIQTNIDNTYKNLGISTLAVAFEDGVYALSSNAQVTKDFDPRTRGWYKEGINKGDVNITSAYFDVVKTDTPCVTITYPIKQKTVLMVL